MTKEERKEYDAQNYLKNKVRIDKQNRASFKKRYEGEEQGREQHLVKSRLNNIRRKETDLEYKVKEMLRANITRHNKFKFEGDESVESILGCDINVFITHIESLMKEGMDWNNRGRTNDSWQIDHIIPLKTSTSREDWIKLNHYKNLQPLWLKEHKQKSKISKHSYKG